MKLQASDLENDIRLIRLIGALDLTGTYEIEIEFVRQCEKAGRVLVDLSEVDYLSSIAINMLVNTARSMANRGGKMGILGPQPQVGDVLDLTGVSQMIPIYSDFASAGAGLSAD